MYIEGVRWFFLGFAFFKRFFVSFYFFSVHTWYIVLSLCSYL